MIELFNMDCMDYLKSLPDKAFKLAVVDPPYGIGEDGSKNHTRDGVASATDYVAFSGNDASAPPLRYFDELRRVSENQIIWGANHFISKIPYDSHCWIVWDKENGDNDFADCELAYTSFKSAVRVFHFRWAGMLQGNMKCKEERIHPTQKPVALYSWIFNRYAKQGDNILDTHLGSGSSAIAAYELGFDFTGIELNEYYFKKAKERLDLRMAQGKLF